MRNHYVAAAALALGALAVSGCGSQEPKDAQVEVGVPGLSVANARLVLSPVKGNPAAVYFDLDYEGTRGLSLRKAEVKGAKSTMLHNYAKVGGKLEMMEALPIPMTKGTKIKFEPGGYHVMAMDLDPAIKPGDKAQVTLTVSGGETYTFDADVRAAGDDR